MSTVTAISGSGGLLRVGEVAKHLGLSRSKVYSMMDMGELSYVRFGKSRRITPEAVAKVIEAGTVCQK